MLFSIHQFNFEATQLYVSDRAVVLEKMNLSTFYSTTVSKTRKFESLASIEKEQLTRKRAEAETKEAMRIFEVSNMKNPKDGLEKASDILEAVQEMEGLYQGFNRTAVKFFRLTGKFLGNIHSTIKFLKSNKFKCKTYIVR